jgi:hypothetical protein
MDVGNLQLEKLQSALCIECNSCNIFLLLDLVGGQDD